MSQSHAAAIAWQPPARRPCKLPSRGGSFLPPAMAKIVDGRRQQGAIFNRRMTKSMPIAHRRHRMAKRPTGAPSPTSPSQPMPPKTFMPSGRIDIYLRRRGLLMTTGGICGCFGHDGSYDDGRADGDCSCRRHASSNKVNAHQSTSGAFHQKWVS